QVEPDNVRLAIADGAQQRRVIAQPVDCPAALHVELCHLRIRSGIFIRKDLEADQRISLQLARHVIPVFVEDNLARRKAADKADLHGPLMFKKTKSKKSKSALPGAEQKCDLG